MLVSLERNMPTEKEALTRISAEHVGIICSLSSSSTHRSRVSNSSLLNSVLQVDREAGASLSAILAPHHSSP